MAIIITRAHRRLRASILFSQDSGVDNNIPFYPLLRKGRDADVIIAIDSSNDLQTHPYFERAAGELTTIVSCSNAIYYY